MATLGLRAARAETLTLSEVEARAQRDRPELAERRASIDRANADRALAVARGRPTVGAKAELLLSPGAQLLELPYDGELYYVQGSKSLSQGALSAIKPLPRFQTVIQGKLTILDFGRTSLGVRAADASILAERASLIQAKVELIRAARKAYLAWLEAHQTWQLAQRDAEVTSARTASVRELIQEGARPATDATLSAYDDQLAKLRQARALRASSLAYESLASALQSELPRDAVPELEVLEPTPAAPSNAAVAASPPPGATPNQALDVLDRQRDAALSAARAADRAHAPQLDVGAELGVSGIDVQVFPSYRAGLSLSVPIYDGGAASAAADQHRAEAHGLEARRQQLEREIASARRAAESALQSAGEELAMSLQLLATAESLLSEAEDHYRSGSDTLERVLSAQRSLVQARREVLTSKLDNARARIELMPVQLRD
ncbi:MAG TPA: TolC family protein [Polyangiaceae bacterium]|nr:TolC family protein [Polyangiaceae bacterium]